MIKFNRLILVLRGILAIFLLNIIIHNLIYYFSYDFNEFPPHYLGVVLTVFLVFTLFGVIRLIYRESLDIEITENAIITKNILTRKSRVYLKKQISGYTIEKYKWNVFKLSGISSFWAFEANQVIVMSHYRAVLHLKSLNYFGIKKIVQSLHQNNYSPHIKRRRYFDRESYRFI
jgi:hypothetical protein